MRGGAKTFLIHSPNQIKGSVPQVWA